MDKVKKTLDKMGWSGWLVVERSRDKEGCTECEEELWN